MISKFLGCSWHVLVLQHGLMNHEDLLPLDSSCSLVSNGLSPSEPCPSCTHPASIVAAFCCCFSKYGSHVPNALYQSKAGFCSSANLCLSRVFHLFSSFASGSLGFSGWWWLRWQLWALSWDSGISTPSKIVVEHPTVTITPNNAGKFFLLSKRMDTEYQSVGFRRLHNHQLGFKWQI